MIAAKELLALTPDQVIWFWEGRRLLAAHEHLRHVKAMLRCKRCQKGNPLPAPVSVTMQPELGRALVMCGHRHGGVQLRKPLDVQMLLDSLGWELACPSCREPIVGDNAPDAKRLSMTCGCTERVYVVPMDEAVAPPLVAAEPPSWRGPEPVV